MTQYYPALTCYIPKNFDVTKVKGYNHRWHEKYIWLIHSVVFDSLTSQQTIGGFINLRSKLLKKFLGDKYYTEIIEQLKQSGVIEENDRYKSGAFSKSFRLTKRYSKGIKSTRIEKQTYCRKIEIFRQNYLAEVLKENELNRYEFMQLTYARIDIHRAMDYIYTRYKEDSLQFKARLIAIEQYHAMHKASFADGRYTNIGFTFKVNKGRIYSPVTMLPRDLEQFTYFIGYEGEAVASADAPNSQLCFFNEYLKRKAKKVHHIGENSISDISMNNKDIVKALVADFRDVPTPQPHPNISVPYVVQNNLSWEEYIFNGKGYERMMYLCAWKGKFSGHTKEERTEFKEEFFGHLFYNRWKPSLTEMERIFMTHHEAEAKALRAIKKKLGNSGLAIEVQRMEAYFFHHIIVNHMMTHHKGVPFTIKHDSINLPAREASYIIPELNQLFKAFFNRSEIEFKVSEL